MDLDSDDTDAEPDYEPPDISCRNLIFVIWDFIVFPASDYWSGDRNFHVPRIAKIMSLKIFLKVIRFIHLNDNSCMPNKDNPNLDRLKKIRPLIHHLEPNIQEVFQPKPLFIN
ncbi:hypothetical protein PR048_003790 [Dryococelus australis]|uniref:PiggyBac transposable element-derived protein domain-containing protein n=1 Tax=Dryococelus australis TaxID=614101 RepID=A0ABQ9IP22_9NEOP|nr:hypothetical protein PR048_003790 [Dryococelus australis]